VPKKGKERIQCAKFPSWRGHTSGVVDEDAGQRASRESVGEGEKEAREEELSFDGCCCVRNSRHTRQERRWGMRSAVCDTATTCGEDTHGVGQIDGSKSALPPRRLQAR
jgi:hypothetical protein